MGVLRSSSCLIRSRKPGAGLRGSSEGKVADRGVLNSLSRADRGVLSSLGKADRGVFSWPGRADRGVLSSLGTADLGASSVGRLGVLSADKTGLDDADGMIDN